MNQQAPTKSAGQTTSEVAFVSTQARTARRTQTFRIRVYSSGRTTPDDDSSTSLPAGATYDLTIERAEELICEDDRWEDNDARTTAEPLASNIGSAPELSDLQICGPDEDWFALPDLPRRAQLRVRLREAAPHLQLDVYSENGAHYGRSPVEAFQLWRNAAEQSWYVRIHSRRQLSGDYRLSYAIDAPWNCPNADQANDASTAIDLSPSIRQTHFLCPLNETWEEDWVTLRPPSSETYLDIRVTETEGSPPLDVTLFERHDDRLALLRSTTEREGLHGASLKVDPSQEILLQISADGEPGNLTQVPEYEVIYNYQESGE